MKLNVFVASLFVSVALVACSDGTPSDGTNNTAEAPAPPVESIVAETVTEKDAKIPGECAEYFEAVDAFVVKYPEAATTYQEKVENMKKQLNDAAMDDMQAFAPTCETEHAAFKQAIASMPQQ